MINNESMHPLLRRQIQKHLAMEPAAVSTELAPLLLAVNASYEHFDADRRLLERTMDLSSDELFAANEQLRRDGERQRILFEKLKESIAALELDDLALDEQDDLLAIAELLRVLIGRRNETQRLLAQSEERFRQIAENSSDLIVRYDAAGLCTYISPSCIPLLGFQPEELIGKTVFDVMHSEDRRATAVALRRSLGSEGPFRLTARISRHDGTFRWFETSIRTIHSGDGEVLEYHTTARDITERREAGERLQAANSRLAALIENLDAGVLVEDDQRTIALVNQTFCTLFGIPAPPQALIGADCSNAAEESKAWFADPEGFVARIGVLLAERRMVVGESLELADGRIYERDYVPIFVEGNYRGHLWSYRDVTGRRRAEQALRQSEERYRQLAETANDAIISIDRKSTILFANHATKTVFGYAPEDVIGRNLEMLMPEYLRHLHAAAMQRYNETHVKHLSWQSLDLPGLHRDGHEVPLSVSFAEAGENDQTFFTGIIRDDTERKRVAEEVKKLNEELSNANAMLRIEHDREKDRVRALEELNAMKNEFVSNVSHELRTPIASIIGFAQTMMVDPDLPADTRGEFLGIIYDEGERLSKLINNLLDIGRIESGRVELDLREVELPALLERAAQGATMAAGAKGLSLRLLLGHTPITVKCDPDRLSQVVINLLDNAIKFTPPGGKVTLEAASGPTETTITVRDTGLGIPPESLPHLFNKFYRVPRSSEIRGTGLGLAIARQLIEMHGGTIEVSSQPERGSAFIIRLPRAAADN